jgi:hypothetical protein
LQPWDKERWNVAYCIMSGMPVAAGSEVTLRDELPRRLASTFAQPNSIEPRIAGRSSAAIRRRRRAKNRTPHHPDADFKASSHPCQRCA